VLLEQSHRQGLQGAARLQISRQPACLVAEWKAAKHTILPQRTRACLIRKQRLELRHRPRPEREIALSVVYEAVSNPPVAVDGDKKILVFVLKPSNLLLHFRVIPLEQRNSSPQIAALIE
jgi:hypothetical protein